MFAVVSLQMYPVFVMEHNRYSFVYSHLLLDSPSKFFSAYGKRLQWLFTFDGYVNSISLFYTPKHFMCIRCGIEICLKGVYCSVLNDGLVYRI